MIPKVAQISVISVTFCNSELIPDMAVTDIKSSLLSIERFETGTYNMNQNMVHL